VGEARLPLTTLSEFPDPPLRVCIFGPYTNNEKAQSVLHMNWNIEERSEIHFSDSVNALVFLYQGSVNQVVDLKRGIADFKDLDICLSRNQANFELRTDANGLKILVLDRSDPFKHQWLKTFGWATTHMIEFSKTSELATPGCERSSSM
jgi:hypothetical protein